MSQMLDNPYEFPMKANQDFYPIQYRCSFTWTHPRVEEKINVLVEQGLVLLVSSAEVLEELMSKLHDLLHSDVLTLPNQTAFIFTSKPYTSLILFHLFSSRPYHILTHTRL